jgi:phage terminase large subunit GpA-like protein
MNSPETQEKSRQALRLRLRTIRRAALKAPPRLTVSEWADQYRRLSPEASAEPGVWITSRAEYQRGIMDAISDPRIDTVVVMSSAQVGKTEIVNNVIGFHVAQDPAPVLVLMPTLELGEAWSKDRLAPMLRDTPALRGKIKDARSRDSGNTLLHKAFPGGHLTICGANSPASLASRPIRVVLCDEVDRYPASAGTEGDPVTLARKRSATFWNRKLVLTSTPTVKGGSRIEMAFEASDQRRYWVPCPHCGEHQVLRWSSVRWPPNEPERAAIHCVACGCEWSDVERWHAIRRGEWRAEVPTNGVAGFHLSELYSPWSRIGDIARAFLEAKKSPETLKAWTNTSLGETWEDAGERLDDTGLMERREEWSDAPADVLVLTAGVDVQDNRLEVEIVGWGRDEESWSLGWHVIHGDPSAPALWADLDRMLTTPLRREDGAELSIAAAAVDSGGHHTQAVYAYCRDRYRRRVYAIKGMAGAGRPVWPKKASKNNSGRVNLFLVGVDAAKEAVYARLKITRPGAGFCHFPADREPDYFAQLTAETISTRYTKGFPVRVWTKRPGARNEALDCRVYAYAALQALAVNWSRLASASATFKRAAPPAVEAARIEQPAAQPAPPAPSRPAPRPAFVRPMRGGWMGGGWRG